MALSGNQLFHNCPFGMFSGHEKENHAKIKQYMTIMVINEKLRISFFCFIIAALQATMLSSTIRAEKIKMKWQDVEHWMDSHFLPINLRKRVRRHQKYKWQKTKDLDVDNLLNNLSKDLKRDIKHHLCFHLIKMVSLFFFF